MFSAGAKRHLRVLNALGFEEVARTEEFVRVKRPEDGVVLKVPLLPDVPREAVANFLAAPGIGYQTYLKAWQGTSKHPN
jgi:hypothetical protein